MTSEEIERQRLALEKERFDKTHHLERDKLELEQRKHGDGGLVAFSKNPMALVGVVAAILSGVQFWISQKARQQEVALAHAKNDAEDDRQWRVALVDFLQAHRADLFSTDDRERQEVVAMLEVAFPSRYSLAVLNKLQLIQSSDGTAANEVVVRELLEPLVQAFDVSKAAFAGWQPNDRVTEEEIRKANLRAKDLLMSKANLIPPELRHDALQLVEHYDAWFAEYERVRGSNRAAQSVEAFVFAGPKGVPFPRNSEQKFREALARRTKPPG